jgi:hypothetical protein
MNDSSFKSEEDSARIKNDYITAYRVSGDLSRAIVKRNLGKTTEPLAPWFTSVRMKNKRRFHHPKQQII